MPIFNITLQAKPLQSASALCLGVLLALSMVGPMDALAFDATEKSPPSVSHSTMLFKFGFSAYSKGDKEEAVEAYQDAADEGHAGARWKLARMYAEGDGVLQDHRKAFDIFEALVREDVRPGSNEGIYVSDAHMALAAYLTHGMKDFGIPKNTAMAQALRLRAASYYGNPSAQFEIARQLMAGKDASRGQIKQAARWLKLSVKKGHAGAEALLGRLYFESGRSVRGLAMMTSAMNKAAPQDRDWIRSMHEEAFAASDDAERRTAIALSDGLQDQD